MNLLKNLILLLLISWMIWLWNIVKQNNNTYIENYTNYAVNLNRQMWWLTSIERSSTWVHFFPSFMSWWSPVTSLYVDMNNIINKGNNQSYSIQLTGVSFMWNLSYSSIRGLFDVPIAIENTQTDFLLNSWYIDHWYMQCKIWWIIPCDWIADRTNLINFSVVPQHISGSVGPYIISVKTIE
jgi:hypothetical protein